MLKTCICTECGIEYTTSGNTKLSQSFCEDHYWKLLKPAYLECATQHFTEEKPKRVMGGVRPVLVQNNFECTAILKQTTNTYQLFIKNGHLFYQQPLNSSRPMQSELITIQNINTVVEFKFSDHSLAFFASTMRDGTFYNHAAKHLIDLLSEKIKNYYCTLYCSCYAYPDIENGMTLYSLQIKKDDSNEHSPVKTLARLIEENCEYPIAIKILIKEREEVSKNDKRP